MDYILSAGLQEAGRSGGWYVALLSFIYQNPIKTVAALVCVTIPLIVFLIYLSLIRNRSNKKIYGLLNLDSLTGIWNFNKFRNELDKMMLTDQRMKYALVYTDIERFKYINDYHGYAQGDYILKAIAQILALMVEDGEIFARVSDDNFVALLYYGDNDTFVDRLQLFNEKLNMIPKGECDYYRMAFVSGVCLIKAEDKDGTQVIDCANEARKSIKGTRYSKYAFFDEEFRQVLRSEQEIEEDMEEALYSNQFTVYYQPQFDFKTLEIVGGEALVRWQHPTRGLILPSQFVPIFEKNGFIVEMDFYIFEQVCRLLREQLDIGLKPVIIASNFSCAHFRRANFLDRLQEIVERYRIPPHLIEIEITESVVSDDVDRVIALLMNMKEIGFSVAMDDFGSGYSSLNMLKDLPIDTLKLDQDFMRKGQLSNKERIIIEGFIKIARQLNISVVCEGVESEEQAEFLREIGGDIAQGYLYARPMPTQEFKDRLYGSAMALQ